MQHDLEMLARETRKKDTQHKSLELEHEKLKRMMKEREYESRSQQDSMKSATDSRMKKMEKDMELLNMYLQNNQETIQAKDREIEKLTLKIYHMEERYKDTSSKEAKITQLHNEVTLREKEIEELQRELHNVKERFQKFEEATKNTENKLSN